MSGESGVRVSPWLLAGGGAVILVLAMTTAFLAGRVTTPNAAPTAVPTVVQVPAAPVVATSTPVSTAPQTTPSSVPPPRPAAAGTSKTPASTGTAPGPTPEQTAVRKYLARLDTIGTGGMPSSPDIYIQQAMAGDTSALDQLIASTEQRSAAINALRPPPPAAAHHAALQTLAAQGLAIMRQLRAGVVSQDLGALMSLQSSATTLQAQGDKVTRMEQELRSAYGG